MMSQDAAAIARDIVALKEWIAKQPHLPQEHEDNWLESFLRGCENSLERCKETLDCYYTSRSIMPDIFSNRDPKSKEQLEAAARFAGFILPGTNPQGCSVIFSKLIETDVKYFDMTVLAKRLSMSADYFLRYNENNEIIMLLDAKDISMSHLLRVPLPLAKDCFACIQGVYPVRIREVLIINPPTFIEVALKMFYPFMQTQLKNMISIKDNLQDLYGTVPQEMLPAEYGGKAPPVAEMNRRWQNKLETGREWFLKEAEKAVDESKRTDKSINSARSDNVFGTGGSFRTINID